MQRETGRMQTGEKERDERSFRHREVPRVESRSVSVLTQRDRNQRVRVTAAGQGSGGGAMPSTVGARGSAAPRALRAANGKGRGQASVLKWRTEEVGRASVDSAACSPFPFGRPVYGSPRRCPRKPHENLRSVQTLARRRRRPPSRSLLLPPPAAVCRYLPFLCPLWRSLPSQSPPPCCPSPPPRQKRNEKKVRF